jgi:hypothetical protein
LAARLGPAGERDRDSPARLEADRSGRIRLHLSPLEAVAEPASLVALREMITRMMPRVDLPEVLLEVDAWTGYLGEFTHAGMSAGSAGSRMRDLATSMAAVLVAQGCNLGFAPIVKPGHPALTRDRLSHVAQNYVRAETLAAANARLITAQSGSTWPGCGAVVCSPRWTGCGSWCRCAPLMPARTRTTSAGAAG